MNNKEKAIKIAEYLGATWQDVPPMSGEWFESLTDDEKKSVSSLHPKRVLSFYDYDFESRHCAPLPFPDSNGDAVSIPSYFEDLNPSFKMEEELNTPANMQKHAWNNYAYLLDTITKGSAFHATPAQRAEAFGVIVGLWEKQDNE